MRQSSIDEELYDVISGFEALVEARQSGPATGNMGVMSMLDDETLNFEGYSRFASQLSGLNVGRGCFEYEEAHRF